MEISAPSVSEDLETSKFSFRMMGTSVASLLIGENILIPVYPPSLFLYLSFLP